MQGGDLRAALSSSGREELRWYQRGKDVLLDVVRAVHFLHLKGVLHRDIKSMVGGSSDGIVRARTLCWIWSGQCTFCT